MLTWADDFEGPVGSPPDSASWGSVVNGAGGGNQQLEYYVPEATELDGNSNLVIAANRNGGTYPAWYGPSQFTSGKLWTQGRVAFRYGYLEVRAAFPCAGQPGAWPAIWMLGVNFLDVGWPACGEIDIMESFGKNADPKQLSAAVHCPGGNASQLYELPAGDDATAFHTYSLDWRPGSLSFSIDGNQYLTVTKKQLGPTWPFQQPFFLILNLAIGGTMGGSVPSTAVFPYRMQVDYARLYGGEVYQASGPVG